MSATLVCNSLTNSSTNTLPIVTWLQQNQGRGVVLTSDCLSRNDFHLWNLDAQSRPKKDISIVICTYGRSQSLNDTLISLSHQTFKSFEVILITEKGHLARLRDKGLRHALSPIVSFIDDDVCCPTTWLESIYKVFKEKGVVGVTGPTTIIQEFQENRDCLKYKKLRKLQEWIFAVSSKPGLLSVCGAPSMGSNFGGCSYQGEVDYLECCNMSVKKKEALDVGGFDHEYVQTGEWSEPDLSLKLKTRGKLYFRTSCGLYHRPSKQGVYASRLSTEHRWENFKRFQRTWIKPSLRRHLYWGFVWGYLRMKSWRMI